MHLLQYNMNYHFGRLLLIFKEEGRWIEKLEFVQSRAGCRKKLEVSSDIFLSEVSSWATLDGY